MRYPKISVVTISYNQGMFVEQAIASVLNQNYDDLEYIIIDGGSTDNTVEVLRKYDHRLTYWVSEKDEGPAHALNKGFSRATGDIYYYLNADDVLLPGTFERFAKIYSSNPGCDLYYGNVYITNGELKILKRFYSDKWSKKAFSAGLVSIAQQASFISASSFKAAEGFVESNKTCWDIELVTDVAINGGVFSKMNIFCGYFRVYGDSISGSGRLNDQYNMDILAIRRKLGDEVRHSSGFAIQLKRMFMNPFQFLLRVKDMVERKLGIGIYG